MKLNKHKLIYIWPQLKYFIYSVKYFVYRAVSGAGYKHS